jgi:hypothetical protein
MQDEECTNGARASEGPTHTDVDQQAEKRVPGFNAVGVFLFFGATMAGIAAVTLLWPGTVLDKAWTLNPNAYKQLALLSGIVGILFVVLGATLVASGIG